MSGLEQGIIRVGSETLIHNEILVFNSLFFGSFIVAINNYSKYLSTIICTLIFISSFFFFFYSCSNNSKLFEKKKEFARMTDKELLNYYYQINSRLDDIDRDTEQNKVIDNINYNPNRDRITHLHIGDTWARLKQEKKLVLNELYKRNITP
jgi:hypothetical protein